MLEMLYQLDQGIPLWIQNNLRCDLLNPIVIFVTSLGNLGLIWIILSIVLIIYPKTRKSGMMCLLSLIFSVLVNNLIIKNLVCRARPFQVIDTLVPLISSTKDYSFPSGHSAASFACATVLFKRHEGLIGKIAMVLAMCIALSRLYIGVHYPTDVIFGVISGVLLGLLAVWTINKIYVRE